MSSGSQLAVAIERLGALQRETAWRGATPAGIGGLQAQILGLLATRERGLTVSQTARQLGVRLPTVSASATALCTAGLVAKAETAGSRARLLTLTTAGRRLAEQLRAAPSVIAAAAEELPDEIVGGALVGLSALVTTLQQRGDIPRQRLCVGCAFFRPGPGARGPHRCALMDVALTATELRLDCPEHQPASEETVSEHLAAIVA